jgi:hypothetical protein
MADTTRTAEIAYCAAWHAGSAPRPLATVDGAPFEVIHRGAWTHGLGPDFRDALILFAGRELRAGSVEIHLSTRGWKDHGHHLDPVYDEVILHVVGRHDGGETRRHDGAIVPVAEMGPISSLAVPDFAAWDWDRVGGHSCAEQTAATRPDVLRAELLRLGDVRLAARTARIEARLATEPPAEIMWGELLDGLGFAANREPMRALAQAVPIESLTSLLLATVTPARLALARGVLLGAAGFLPLSPSEAHLGRLAVADVMALEEAWQGRGAPWRPRGERVSATAWNRARVRPANHPVPRILAAANVAATASGKGGLLTTILDLMRGAADPIRALRDLTRSEDSPGIGADRAVDILASGVIPLALAYAAHSGDQALADAVSRHWERLPAPAASAVSRRAARQVAGATRLPGIGARGAQGLLHLDTALCQPRRCFECPIAALELSVNG